MKMKIIILGILIMLVFASIPLVNARYTYTNKTIEKYETLLKSKKNNISNYDNTFMCNYFLFRFIMFFITCCNTGYGCIRCLLYNCLLECYCNTTTTQ